MKTLFKVVTQTDPITIQKQDGTTTTKSTLVLTEVGSKFEDQYLCTLLGNLAQCRYYPNDVVWASLRFTTHERQGLHYQDITVQDIIPFTFH